MRWCGYHPCICRAWLRSCPRLDPHFVPVGTSRVKIEAHRAYGARETTWAASPYLQGLWALFRRHLGRYLLTEPFSCLFRWSIYPSTQAEPRVDAWKETPRRWQLASGGQWERCVCVAGRNLAKYPIASFGESRERMLNP